MSSSSPSPAAAPPLNSSPPPIQTTPPAAPPVTPPPPPVTQPPPVTPSPNSLVTPPSPPPPPPSAPPPPRRLISSPPPPASSEDSSASVGVIAGVAAGAVAVVFFLGLSVLCCLRARKTRNAPKGYFYASQIPTPLPVTSGSGGSAPYHSGPEISPSQPSIFLSFKKSNFTYEELAVATNGFSSANLLGEGGFGYVYRGMLDGKEVAVKELKVWGGQGDREFYAEVETISRVHHKNLVALVGYCISNGRRILVYEYVPNKTLEFHLHEKDSPALNWSARFKIALGAAKGLTYLHEDCHPTIIHRDIKASNILLDSNFEPKVADFGMAKFQNENNTHVTTRVVGTFGYLAPEYMNSGRVTDRSDVYSFGIVLLELITGRRPVYTKENDMDETLVEWARPLLTTASEDSNYYELIDPRLEMNYDPDEMNRLIACAAACMHQSAQRRPRMSQVVRYLQGDISLESLNAGVIPGYSKIQGSSGFGDTEEHMVRLRRVAFANGDYTSSEYSAPTTETHNVSRVSCSEVEVKRPSRFQ